MFFTKTALKLRVGTTALCNRKWFDKYLQIFLYDSAHSGQHTHATIKSKLYYYYYYKLIYTSNKKSGHNITGKLTIHTKGATVKRKQFNYLKKFNKFKYFVYNIWLGFKVLKKRFFMLTILSDGSICYMPLTNRCHIFALLLGEGFHTIFHLMHVQFRVRGSVCGAIINITHLMRFCYVSINTTREATIAKAAGTSCRVIKQLKLGDEHFTIIQLPSAKLKIVHATIIVLYGYIVPKKYFLIKNTKAGYWRNLGKKPQVRGVVKNPVDHPHGGRVRTVWKPRTPWGKYTK